MSLRPLDAAELEAIARWLEQHAPTVCPATAQGLVLPFIQSLETRKIQAAAARRELMHQERLRRHRAAAYLWLS